MDPIAHEPSKATNTPRPWSRPEIEALPRLTDITLVSAPLVIGAPPPGASTGGSTVLG